MCPDCRLQHKLNFRNERTFYKRTSSLSGKPIISIYDERCPYPIYAQDEWWGDTWNALDYGQDFDFNRPFFEQFRELALKVPRIALFNVNPTNSDYCQQAYDNKNSYLCVVVEKCEDCMYISHSNDLRDCFDCSFLHECELCYDCMDSNKLYSCASCASCQNSSDLFYCYDCIGCQNCVGCYGLRNKQFYIMNEPHTKEEYFKKLEMLELGKYSKLQNAKRYFADLTKSMPHRANRNLNVENSSGNYLINCQNAHECYDSFQLQDCAYCTWIFHSHDCMDVYGLGHGEWVYEGLGVEAVNNCAFNTFVSDSSDVFYSDICFYSMYLFGCVGVRNKKYCILNKQYSAEEYESLRLRIIEHMKQSGEWGRFFPVDLSPFSYNETAANYHFPLGKEQILSAGFRWKEPDKKEYMPASMQLPDDVKELDASVCEALLACMDCGKNYKLMPKELSYYKRISIAAPRKCLDCRFLDRFRSRNSRGLFERKCDKCAAPMQSSYKTDSGLKVYCENCYKEIVN
ncbi:hypothetical protein HY605_03785 [Candidatus Peregrinibacteria bacterium]|nr:hypothetical protein [Candidatus Peregrinibacteria bacterium]